MKAKKGTKLREWQQQKIGLCATCGKERDVTVDHVIPVYLLEQLGLDDAILNDEENFEHVCLPCNRYKGCRLDLANPKTIPLLKKYVALVQ